MNQHMTMMDYILLQPETMQEIFDNRQESLKDFPGLLPAGAA